MTNLMMQRDRASASLGMVVLRDEPGRAVVSMTIRDDMLNGFDMVHGGIVFALADTAFAIACNDGETMTVGAAADITFLRPVRHGQTLTATAILRSSSGRTGLYDVQISDGTNVVAEFRGRSHTTSTPATASSDDR